MSIFSERFKELRLRNRMTTSQLAKVLNISVKTVISYEQGKTIPNLNTFIRICLFFNVSARYLLGL